MHVGDCAYEGMRRIVYDEGATFIPVCIACHRFVKADATVAVNDARGLSDAPNATCSLCGRTWMHFEGFVG